jgi:glycosyltransferase involved in cell wall biosynthesis
MYPLLSIIIPTKDREPYLMDVLKSVLSWTRKDFEVIVHDNSENDRLQDMIQPLLEDFRVNYIHVKEWLAGVDNFENAVAIANGRFVTMIGDDDGVFEEIMQAVDWMNKDNVDAMLPDRGHYTWPDLVYSYNNDYFNSILRVDSSFDSHVSYIDPLNELYKVLDSGASSLCDLPRLYYGVVSKSVLDEVKALTGQYFPGPSPDMANAVSTALVVKSFAKLNYPLFISGNCSQSTAGLGAKHLHEGEIDKIPFLPKTCKVEWESEVPLFWSGPTIWAEAAIKTLRKMKSEHLVKKFNFASLYARCLIFNSNNAALTLLKLKERSSISLYLKVAVEYLKVWRMRLRALLKKRATFLFLSKETGEVFTISNQNCISKAIESFSSQTLSTNQVFIKPKSNKC